MMAAEFCHFFFKFTANISAHCSFRLWINDDKWTTWLKSSRKLSSFVIHLVQLVSICIVNGRHCVGLFVSFCWRLLIGNWRYYKSYWWKLNSFKNRHKSNFVKKWVFFFVFSTMDNLHQFDELWLVLPICRYVWVQSKGRESTHTQGINKDA